MTTYSSNFATDSSIPEETMLQHEILAPERPERSAGMFSQQTTLGGVLVIDDEPDVRKVIFTTFRTSGSSSTTSTRPFVSCPLNIPPVASDITTLLLVMADNSSVI